MALGYEFSWLELLLNGSRTTIFFLKLSQERLLESFAMLYSPTAAVPSAMMVATLLTALVKDEITTAIMTEKGNCESRIVGAGFHMIL